MKNKKTVIVLLCAFVLLFAGASVLYAVLGDQVETNQLAAGEANGPEGPAQQETAAENQVPDFTVTDSAGHQVSLSDFFGKPIILNFWASWCGPCKSEMPDFDEAYQAYQEDIHFLMVNLTDGMRETVQSASSYVEEQGFTFPVYYDTESEAAVTYQVSSVPTTYFIDAAGNLTAQAQGAIDRATLQKGIDMIYTPRS